jgi:hypothetical protein
MMSLFIPRFTGEFTPEAISSAFLEKLAHRVRTGLFPMASPRRNAYRITTQTDNSLQFRSANLLTGINVGLNDVTVTIDNKTGSINYKVSYWTWATYCICLSLLIGVCLVGAKYYIPSGYYPDINENSLFWPLIVFCCLIWPWVLIAIHKGPARKCLNRILDEVNNA